ncbi:alpha-hydroxy-acid oxidizing protein [Paraburkholderia nemoris]|uniref:alpha-hydroxy-acid oxidizing protein n=1 Tax=Paraburkholderia nemoris TaxID=2793076 RepID=UPI0038BDEECC
MPLEEVAAEYPQAWFQAYLPGEPATIAALVDGVKRAGFQTLVVTVDTPVVENRGITCVPDFRRFGLLSDSRAGNGGKVTVGRVSARHTFYCAGSSDEQRPCAIELAPRRGIKRRDRDVAAGSRAHFVEL